MKKIYLKIICFLLVPLFFTGCLFSDYPVDEDDLLITNRAECYVSSFQLLGTDLVNVHVNKQPAAIDPNRVHNVIDTVACTINVYVRYGADLKNVCPQFSLVTDAKLDPKVEGYTDFSDISNPKQYTVVSGNRNVRKTYTIHITQQEFQIP